MASFTPQQIEEFLQEFFDVVGTRQYIGARYVPIFGRQGESSIEWDNTAPYEPLSIVTHEGNSYTSRTYVPVGIDILNTDYWVNTGNFNAQVEQYRQEVVNLQNSWTVWREDTEDAIETWESDTEADLNQWKTDIETDLPDMVETALETAPSRFLTNANILCVTDSWGREDAYGVTKCWMRQFCEILGANYIDLHQGSTGYLKAPTFRTRLNAWATANPDLVPAVNVVLVSGSCNDNLYSHQAIADEIQLFVNTCNTLMPKALCIVVPIIFNNNPIVSLNVADGTTLDNTWLNSLYAHYTFRNKAQGNYIFLDGLSYFFVGAPDTTFNTDLTHPTQASHNMLARAVASRLLGGATDHYAQWVNSQMIPMIGTELAMTNLASVSNTSYINMQIFDDHIHISVEARIASMCALGTNNAFFVGIPFVGLFSIPVRVQTNGFSIVFGTNNVLIGRATLNSRPQNYRTSADVPSNAFLLLVQCNLFNPTNLDPTGMDGFFNMNIDVPIGFMR